MGWKWEVMCDKGRAALPCSVFLFCPSCSTSHLTLTPGVVQVVFSPRPARPAANLSLPSLLTPAFTLTLPTPRPRLRPPRRDRFDTSSLHPSLDKFSSWSWSRHRGLQLLPAARNRRYLLLDPRTNEQPGPLPSTSNSIHPRIHLEWPWYLQRHCKKKNTKPNNIWHWQIP
jgi:hypothetical protein